MKNLKSGCDFCRQRFAAKSDLINHITNNHEVRISKEIFIQEVALFNKLKALKLKENESKMHNCNSECRINYTVFNKINILSDEYMEMLNQINNRESNMHDINHDCERTFINNFASTQETFS